ncbi:MAG TPA: MFS transporter [Stackebrandtia sp.]|jgi:MFS family permease|uniref:MFS transporter n=1 Tax=Stackebrandtia sp. TaxID=2023065 RepID=UPI002D311C70|nr:MFS transporter [Stackebrandtia sp.]HZE37503.1 MFS transporter [Stackebrandtia sp.]
MTEAPALPRARSGFDRRLVAPMLLGSVLNPINSSIIAVALVPIGVAFGAAPSATAWLVSGLYVATAVGQPVVGRLVDIYGPRPLYLIGTGLTGIAGILGVTAPHLGVLVAARVILGVGTCAGYPAAMSLIRSEARRTGQDSPAGVLTMLAVANQTVAVIGPSLGGFLIGVGGWRATFAVNIPLSAACLILGWLLLPRTEKSQRPDARIDLWGIALFTLMLVSLLLFVMNPHLSTLYLAGLALAAGAGFTVRELRCAQPFIDLRLFGGNLPLLATYGRNLLAMIVAYGFLYGYTQWLEDGRGLSASTTGLLLLPLFGTGIVVSVVSGRRAGVRGKLLIGGLGQVVAITLLLFTGSSTALWALVIVALTAGIPQGLNSLAMQNAVYFQADAARLASSAGLLRTFTYLGAIAASAANAAFLRHGADTPGMHQLAWFMLAAAVVFLAVTVFDRSLSGVGRPRTETPA